MKLPFLHRSLMTWCEPQEFRTRWDAYEKMSIGWWCFRLPGVTLIECIVLLECFGLFFLYKRPRLSLALMGMMFVATLVLLAFCYWGSWKNWKQPSCVTLFPKMLEKKRGQIWRRYHLSEIKSFAWLDNGSYHALVLEYGEDEKPLFGIPDLATRQKVEEVLLAAGVKRRQI